MTSPRTETPGQKRRIRLALALLALPLAAALAEVAVRVSDRARGRPYGAAECEAEAQAVVDAMGSMAQRWEKRTRQPADDSAPPVVLHPYLAYDVPAQVEQTARDVEYFHSEESRRTYDVFVVGGSVARAFGNYGAETLARLLQSDARFAGRPVRVHSQGRIGYKQPQQLILVAYLLGLGCQPDVVVNIDGFNDCALANANIAAHVHPVHPSVEQWAHLASDPYVDRLSTDLLFAIRVSQRQASELLARSRSLGAYHSAVLGELALRRLKVLRTRFLSDSRRYLEHLNEKRKSVVAGPPLPPSDEGARELALRNWFESSRSLDALCRARSIAYLHVLQPTLTDPGSKPLTPSEIEDSACQPPLREGVLFGYPRMRALGAELRASGVHFVDASYLFQGVTETLYYDVCHFDQPGIELLAQRVAAAILAEASPVGSK